MSACGWSAARTRSQSSGVRSYSGIASPSQPAGRPTHRRIPKLLRVVGVSGSSGRPVKVAMLPCHLAGKHSDRADLYERASPDGAPRSRTIRRLGERSP
jgi:hypothetical protein